MLVDWAATVWTRLVDLMSEDDTEKLQCFYNFLSYSIWCCCLSVWWEMVIQTVRTSSGNIYLIKYVTSVFPRVGNPDEHNWWWLANQTKERAQSENVLSLVETSVSCYCGIPGRTKTNLPLCLHWDPVCTAEWLWMLTPFLLKYAKQF